MLYNSPKRANFAVMKDILHDSIIFSTEFTGINSPAYYECIIHLICTCGKGVFTYNGVPFTIGINDIVIISRPQSVSDIMASDDFQCEYIVAPEKFLHSLLPAVSVSIQFADYPNVNKSFAVLAALSYRLQVQMMQLFF